MAKPKGKHISKKRSAAAVPVAKKAAQQYERPAGKQQQRYGRQQQGQQKPRPGKATTVAGDIYEAEDSDPDEIKHPTHYDVRGLAAEMGRILGGICDQQSPASLLYWRCIALLDGHLFLLDLDASNLLCTPLAFLNSKRVENYEYEQPEEFEDDEEIDEENAFTEEDKKKYAGWFDEGHNGSEEGDDDDDAESGSEDDERRPSSSAKGDIDLLDSDEEEQVCFSWADMM